MTARLRAAGLRVSLLLLAGCGERSEFMAWPALPAETRSALFAWAQPDQAAQLELLEISPGEALPPRSVEVFDDPRPTQLALLTYPDGPERLGVAPGPVRLARPDECLGRIVPPGALAFSVELDAGPFGVWTQQPEARPGWLDQVRYLAPCPCERWRYDSALTLAGEGSAVVRGDELYLFRRRLPNAGIAILDLATRESVDLPLLPPRRIENSDGSPGGRVFVVATSTETGPEVLEFTSDHELVPIPDVPFDGDVPDAIVVGEGQPLEVYVLTSVGRLLGFEEGRGWTVHQDEGLVWGQGGGRQTATLTWHGPGVVTAAVHDSSAVIQTSPGRPAAVFIPPLPEFQQAIRALLYTESFGLVVANFGGGLARALTPERWEVFPLESGLGRINSLLPHPQGLLITGDLGWAQLHVEAGVCPIIMSEAARQSQGLAGWRGQMVGWARGLAADTTVIRYFVPGD